MFARFRPQALALCLVSEALSSCSVANMPTVSKLDADAIVYTNSMVKKIATNWSPDDFRAEASPNLAKLIDAEPEKIKRKFRHSSKKLGAVETIQNTQVLKQTMKAMLNEGPSYEASLVSDVTFEKYKEPSKIETNVLYWKDKWYLQGFFVDSDAFKKHHKHHEEQNADGQDESQDEQKDKPAEGQSSK